MKIKEKNAAVWPISAPSYYTIAQENHPSFILNLTVLQIQAYDDNFVLKCGNCYTVHKIDLSMTYGNL